MDVSKMVNHYIRVGYTFAPNGDVLDQRGRVVDHLTTPALNGLAENKKVTHDLARHIRPNRIRGRSEAIDNKSASANTEKGEA